MPDARVEFARRLRHDQTSAEENLWQSLRAKRLDGWKFRRQVPIGGFVVDFCCFEARLTIELDGVHHRQQVEADDQRRRSIEAQGHLELRFTNNDVLMRHDWVLTEIRRALDLAKARPMRAAFPRMEQT